jgi:hypothetical protein
MRASEPALALAADGNRYDQRNGAPHYELQGAAQRGTNKP